MVAYVTAAAGKADSTYFIAGLAYGAHVLDIRPDLTGTQTISTYWMDVEEYGYPDNLNPITWPPSTAASPCRRLQPLQHHAADARLVGYHQQRMRHMACIEMGANLHNSSTCRIIISRPAMRG
jgi:hypothetical protein